MPGRSLGLIAASIEMVAISKRPAINRAMAASVRTSLVVAAGVTDSLVAAAGGSLTLARSEHFAGTSAAAGAAYCADAAEV